MLARGDAVTLHVGGPRGIWDHAAGILLAEESGYCISNAAGGAFFPSGWAETKSMIALLDMRVAKHMLRWHLYLMVRSRQFLQHSDFTADVSFFKHIVWNVVALDA